MGPERERQIQRGPRGLGWVIGLEVDDLDATYAKCTEGGCEITCEPMDEPWGERLFTCLDPFGYEWEFSVPVPRMESAEGTDAARESWFGGHGLVQRTFSAIAAKRTDCAAAFM